MSPGSSHLIKAEREPESARCGPACGPSPLRVSVLCIVIISFWILIICIMHLDKKMTGVQMTLDNTDKLLDSMEDSANEFRHESFQKLKKMEERKGRKGGEAKTSPRNDSNKY